MSDLFTLIGAGVKRFGQRVREEGQAEVFATTVDEFENVSARVRLSFSWTIVPANFSNGETLLLVQNDHDDLFLHMIEARLESDTATAVQVHLTNRVVLVPAGGTVVTGVCWNQTAPKVAKALARSNETANAQGNVIHNEPMPANTPTEIDLHGAVILGKGQSVAIDLTTGPSSLASCNLRGFYAIPDEDRV